VDVEIDRVQDPTRIAGEALAHAAQLEKCHVD
jgi:hypothetical protein